MTRSEVTGCKPLEKAPAAYNIAEFCQAHRISLAFYYKLRAMGLGPDEMRVGTRRLISLEAAATWRRQRETTSTVNNTS